MTWGYAFLHLENKGKQGVIQKDLHNYTEPSIVHAC